MTRIPSPAAEIRRAFWQRDLLWSDDVVLAEVKSGGLLGWNVHLPSSSPLVGALEEPDFSDRSSQLGSHAAAKRFAADLARREGYVMISGRAGLERVAAAARDALAVTRRFRIRPGVRPYPGKIIEARTVTDREVKGHVHLSASKVATAERNYRLDEVDEIVGPGDASGGPAFR